MGWRVGLDFCSIILGTLGGLPVPAVLRLLLSSNDFRACAKRCCSSSDPEMECPFSGFFARASAPFGAFLGITPPFLGGGGGGRLSSSDENSVAPLGYFFGRRLPLGGGGGRDSSSDEDEMGWTGWDLAVRGFLPPPPPFVGPLPGILPAGRRRA